MRRSSYRTRGTELVASKAEPIRVLLVISNLSLAGGQRQLLTAAEHFDRGKIIPEICALSAGGELESEILALGIPLWRVTKKFLWDSTIFLRFAGLCRKRKIQVVYSFLDFDNLVGRVGGRLAGVPAIIASELNADYRLPYVKDRLERWTIGLSDLIITNSEAGKQYLINDKRLAADRIKVILSSLDPKVLASDRSPGDIRRLYSIPQDVILIGLAARRRPQKNFELCFQVADEITRLFPDVWFLLLGDTAPTFEDYSKWVDARYKELTHKNRVILGGFVRDIGAFYRDLDIFLITSDHEGLPNVLMGAMACGKPVVATDVGDNGNLIGDQGGFITPPGNKPEMVSALSTLIKDKEMRLKMGEYNCKRAQELFSVERMVSETEGVILELYNSKTNKK